MNKYFAYIHIHGDLLVKRYSKIAYDDAFDSDFVDEISNVIHAKNRNDAEKQAKRWAKIMQPTRF